jgi:lipopolysaccharide export system protein LptC
LHEVPPGIAFEDLQFRSYRGADLVVSGQADRASYRRDNGQLTAEQITARFPGRGGEPEAVVEARAGTGSLKSSQFQLYGGVTAWRGTMVARTPEASFDRAVGLLQGEGPVSIEGPGYSLEGAGFTYDPARERIRMGSGVRLTLAGGAGR